MTETNACGFGFLRDDYLQKPNNAGWLYPPLQALQILDDDENAFPVGHVREIAVKSACNMRGSLISPKLLRRYFKMDR